MSASEEPLSLFDGEIPIFEQKGRPNGYTTWSARELAAWLGYSDFTSFKGVLKRAQEVLLTLNVEITDHFNQETSTDEKGRTSKDVRLSRFACYLAAMSGDVKKAPVARAHAYFARFSEECQRFRDDGEPIERVLIRKEVSKHERTLSITAKRAGANDFALFRNAGYRGLYNMNLNELKKLKKLPDDRTPLDFMGKDELAANLFRITQTDAKIQRSNIRGQSKLEAMAEDVGRTVRETMHKISGQRPEDLPPQDDIKVVRSALKAAGKVLKRVGPSDLKELPPADEYLAPAEESDPD